MRTAFSDLTKFSITSNDWKVFGYLVGRGAPLGLGDNGRLVDVWVFRVLSETALFAEYR